MRRASCASHKPYAAFLVRAIRTLAHGDGLVAITPRSFSNGPYFRDLRSDLLTRASFHRIHVFATRDRIFADADVLQENIIFSMQLGTPPTDITITTSLDAIDSLNLVTRHPNQVVHPNDPQRFIRLPLDDDALSIAERMATMPCTLSALGCSVSTGRVVDFRVKEYLRMAPDKGHRSVGLSAQPAYWTSRMARCNPQATSTTCHEHHS